MRVFVWAGAGDRAGFQNPGAIVEGTTAALELALLVERLFPALAAQQVTLLVPPADLTFREGLQWIEDRTEPGDGAIELRLGAFARPEVRGASAFFIAINAERQLQADVLLQTLVQGVPGLVQRGARPDTESALGRLAFCRDLRAPSLSLELGYLTNPSDRALLQTRRGDLAIALATGLRQWPPPPFPPTFPPLA
ncbi:MAG: N-acetylmuramoyl-L-alanine amidase [Pseudanabaenaceae cyanobacterium]